MLQLQDCLNSEIEQPTSILVLAKCYLSINKET